LYSPTVWFDDDERGEGSDELILEGQVEGPLQIVAEHQALTRALAINFLLRWKSQR
jgi:hypothetical protein